jgi:hypothetical protein
MEEGKIIAISKIAHRKHRRYCNSINHPTQPSWEDLSDNHKKTIESTVEKIVNGEIKSIEDSHANFVEFKKSTGWVFGDEYSEKDKTNPRLCDFNDLSTEDMTKESIFFECVNGVM